MKRSPPSTPHGPKCTKAVLHTTKAVDDEKRECRHLGAERRKRGQPGIKLAKCLVAVSSDLSLKPHQRLQRPSKKVPVAVSVSCRSSLFMLFSLLLGLAASNDVTSTFFAFPDIYFSIFSAQTPNISRILPDPEKETWERDARLSARDSWWCRILVYL